MLIKAADIKALMLPDNEPLTLDELRGMDGEAVYLVDMEPVEYGWEDGYYLVDTDEDVAFNGIRKFNLKLCAGFAYRTKPEQPEREADHGR
ncbi:hypothetical protein [Oscillibacter ruminantium]|uniref:hypothetical protein n=1 Tax=Oscillibacter ruminantium TaxID=1263547 RepID=UPI0003166842|nr:hypothetical protein [Oscillibacter ruminantium]